MAISFLGIYPARQLTAALQSIHGCKMYPEMDEGATTATTSQTPIMGVAPAKGNLPSSSEAGAAENRGCTCNPCTCGK